MKGAGGTSGGVGLFFVGVIMLIGGVYLLLNSIHVTSNFGASLYGFSAFGSHFGITSGIIMIPFMFGVGIVFYNSKNVIGWFLAGGSIIALVFGVISSIHFTFSRMSAFDLIVILVLAVGGLGILLRSFRSSDLKEEE
jgi:hypothetical protein